jgi:spermidine/putrescine-binding protein
MSDSRNQASPQNQDLLTRRRALQRGAAFGALAAIGPGVLAACGGSSSSSTSSDGGGSSDSLNVLTWEGYHDTAWLEEYADKTGVTVKASNVSSPAEAFAKVQAAPDQYDIVVVTGGFFKQFVDADLLVPIDEAKVPNAKNISEELPFREATTVSNKNYGLLYQWGDQYMGWNLEEIPGSYDLSKYLNSEGEPADWNIFWDPQLEGKVSMFDDPVSAYPVIPLALGISDPYNLTDEQFEMVGQKLEELRPQIASLVTGANGQAGAFTSGEAVTGYMLNTSVDELAAEKGVKLGQQHEVKQGVPAWSDNVAITKDGGGNKLDTVYEFVNESFSIPWLKRLQQAFVGNVPLSYQAATKAGLSGAELEKTLLPYSKDPSFFENLKFFKEANDPDRRLQQWNEFKLGIGG